MDRRIDYKIVLDTETCPLDKELQGVDPYNMWVYDIGWAVCDKHGRVYEKRSYINVDIFLHEKELMKSAYYAEKIPKYWEDIKSGKRIMKSFYNIRKQFIEDIKKYEVKRIFAHNMRFDNGSLNNTQRWITKSKYRYFFPRGLEICDTLSMARSVVANTPTYKMWCKEKGYCTKNGRPKLTAEILYRFITGDNDFIESHTGLEDVLVEVKIMAYCYAKHKAMKRIWFIS